MKLTVEHIPESPKEVRYAEKVEDLNLLYSGQTVPDFRFPACVDVDLIYYRSGQDIFFEGRLGAVGQALVAVPVAVPRLPPRPRARGRLDVPPAQEAVGRRGAEEGLDLGDRLDRVVLRRQVDQPEFTLGDLSLCTGSVGARRAGRVDDAGEGDLDPHQIRDFALHQRSVERVLERR